MTSPETQFGLSEQLDLAEIRLHLETLTSVSTDLAPEIRRTQRALIEYLEGQEIDLERLWLEIEPELGLTSQQHEAVRLLREELSEQARPVSFAAAGGFILFTSLAGGGDLDVDMGDGGASLDSGPVAMQSVDYDPDLDTSRYPASEELAPELAEVVASYPPLADALNELLDDGHVSDAGDVGSTGATGLDGVGGRGTSDDAEPAATGIVLGDGFGSQSGGNQAPGIGGSGEPGSGELGGSEAGAQLGLADGAGAGESPTAGGVTPLSDGDSSDGVRGSGDTDIENDAEESQNDDPEAGSASAAPDTTPAEETIEAAQEIDADDGDEGDEHSEPADDDSNGDGDSDNVDLEAAQDIESNDEIEDDSDEGGDKGPKGNNASAVAGTTPGEEIAESARDGGNAGEVPGDDVSDLATGGSDDAGVELVEDDAGDDGDRGNDDIEDAQAIESADLDADDNSDQAEDGGTD